VFVLAMRGVISLDLITVGLALLADMLLSCYKIRLCVSTIFFLMYFVCQKVWKTR